MSHGTWVEMAEIYALGALDGDERRRFEGHLAGCAECSRIVSASSESLADLAALAAVRPPAAVGQRLMERVHRSLVAPAAAPKRTPVPAWIGLGAAAAACLAFVLIRVIPLGEPAIPYAPAPAAGAPAHDAAFVAMMHSPETHVIRFDTQGTFEGSAKLAWNTKECRGCFSARGLKALPAGRTFQLWAIDSDGTPVSMGVFEADQEGHAHADFPAISSDREYQQFAVTIEPGGGMLKPTGPMMLVGKI